MLTASAPNADALTKPRPSLSVHTRSSAHPAHQQGVITKPEIDALLTGMPGSFEISNANGRAAHLHGEGLIFWDTYM
jgi:hypothetical protein